MQKKEQQLERNEFNTQEFFNPTQGRKMIAPDRQQQSDKRQQQQQQEQPKMQKANQYQISAVQDFRNYSQQQKELRNGKVGIKEIMKIQEINQQMDSDIKFKKDNPFEKKAFRKKKGICADQKVNPQANKPFKKQVPVYQPTGNEPTVLMVAEKPSIAKSLADALSAQWGGHQTRKGISQYCRIHEYYGEIFGQQALIKITSVTGHIYITDFSDEFQDWHRVDPLLLFGATTVKKEANPSNDLISHLRQEAQDISYLILWLDNDKEGENICFEVIENIKDLMRSEPFKQIYRAKFSSITKQDILHAFSTLSEGPNQYEAISVDARQIIDLKIGVAFSRFQTIYLKKRYESLTQRLITFGPCQTPTLGFCVERHLQIKSFQQQDFWRVVPQIMLPDGKMQNLDWDQDRTYIEPEAFKVKQDLEQIRLIEVFDVVQKETIKGRPQALDTVHLLKNSSSQLQLGPNQAMEIAEKLYLGGFITYPRTESTSYPKNFDFNGVINSQMQIPIFKQYVNKLLEEGLERPKIGKDAGDHPPITPTLKIPSPQDLTESEWRMYEYICRHFLGSVSPDAKSSKQIAKFGAGKHIFTVQGITILNYGFTEIMPWIKLHDKTIPNFQKGQTFMPTRIDIVAGKTTPPDYLTESDLITLMEKNGIGTDASMASHINNICERNYVVVRGLHRKLVPTPLGVSLVEAYNKIDSELVAPNLRSNIEKSVDLIAKGIADSKKVLEEVLAIFMEKFQYFRDNIGEMDKYFKDTFVTYYDAINNASYLSTCGRCGQLMKYLFNSNKLHCPQCRYTYSLPLGGELCLFEEDAICPLDKFQLVMLKPSSTDSQPLLLCPACYNKSPYPQISPHLKCIECPVKECRFNGFVFGGSSTMGYMANTNLIRQPFSKAKIPSSNNQVPQQQQIYKKQDEFKPEFQGVPINNIFIQKRPKPPEKENLTQHKNNEMYNNNIYDENETQAHIPINSRKQFKKNESTIFFK